MTAQEHAPVVPVAQTGAAAPAPHGPAEHPVVAHLRERLARAVAHADGIAGRGGHERETAARHLAQAARCDEDAMRARADVDTWRDLLEVAIAKVGKPGTREPANPPVRPAVEPARPPILHCNGCGRPLRPATPDEQAAAQAGRPPDLRRECPTCLQKLCLPDLVERPERPEQAS